ncbi:MAG: ATP-binding protein, partial [Vicinamibacterales bacterium]
MKASLLSVPEPYVGLRPFDKADAHLFFGRDTQVDELLARLRTQRFVVVMGTSGSGKSSLVRAGLIPALEGGFIASAGSAWRVAVIRPGGNPIGNLSSALIGAYASVIKDDLATHRSILEAVLRRGCFGLVDAVRECPVARTEPLLVVVDQFEELFRFKASEDRHGASDHAAAFVKLLLQAVRQAEHPIHVVITMRSEFLGDCAEFPELPERINEALFLIPRLTRDQLAEAIIGPAAVAGVRVAPSLVQRLLNDVGDDPDQLPVLQHALMRMWQRLVKEPGKGQLSLEHYGAVKGLDEALSDHADEAFAELDDRQRVIAERVFKCLTDRGGGNRDVRRPTRFAELCEIAGASETEVAAVLEHFRREGRSFIMPAYGQTVLPETFVDLSHESLFRKWERLRLWVGEEAENRKLFMRLSDSAAAHAAGTEPLWRDPQLAIALDWRARFSPTPAWAKRYGRDLQPALAFLDESYDARERDRRRVSLRRYGWITTAGVLIVALCGCWWLWDKFRHEREAKRETELHAGLEGEKAALAEKLKRAAEERHLFERQAADTAVQLAAAESAATAIRLRDAELLRQRLIMRVNQRLNPYGSTVGTLVALQAYRHALAAGLPDIVSRADADLARNLALFQKQIWETRLPQAATRVAAPASLPIVVAGTASSLGVWTVAGSALSEAAAPTLPTPVRNLSFSAGGRRVAWISRGT